MKFLSELLLRINQSNKSYSLASWIMFLMLPTNARIANIILKPAIATFIHNSNPLGLRDDIHKRLGSMNVIGMSPMLAINPCRKQKYFI